MNNAKTTMSKGWQPQVLAYLSLVVLISGDSFFAEDYIRANPVWSIWLVLALASVTGSSYFLLRADWFRVIRQIPIELALLLALMIGSSPWSAYADETISGFLIQIGVTVIALFFAAVFSWRELLKIFANAIRIIIFGSFAVELFTSTFKGILPKLIVGVDPAIQDAFTQSGHLFDGGRIQGLLGNANLVAAWALIGVITFAIEIGVTKSRKTLSIASLVASLVMILVSKSAGIIFASIAVLLAAAVSLLAEGKDRDTRHRYYRIAWSLAGVAMFFVLVFRRAVFDLLGKSPDMTHRSEIWRRVLSLISQRPLEGWGFTGVWVPGVKPYEGLVVINGESYYQAHNAYLDMWLQLGAVGLVLFIVLLTRTFVKTWRLGVHHTNVLYLWPLLVLITQLVRGVTESRLLVQSSMMMLILFAVKSHDPEELLEPNKHTTKRDRLERLGRRPITRLLRR
ncbi:MAG: O-antigen ligase family protein [Actinobacteria bacterium]|nr:O-antigen ligase family protein [Actinomycetota bacterium]